MGLCGILSHKLGARHVFLTDGDVDTLENLRRNVERNACDSNTVSCPQLIWGSSNQYPKEIDIILGADIIYMTETLGPLWETVSKVLAQEGTFLLGYARRNVSIDLVLRYAVDHGFVWTCPSGDEGIFTFSRR